MRELKKKEIARLFEAEVIESNRTECTSPLVLVPKRDGTLRLCVEKRKTTSATVRESQPLRGMDECIDALGDGQVFFDTVGQQ